MLPELANGFHKVTIYAWDETSNVGASETVYFSVDVPFPTTLVITASVASVSVIDVGLLMYFKKRKQKTS